MHIMRLQLHQNSMGRKGSEQKLLIPTGKDQPVEYYSDLNSAVTDNFESMLESMNEIIHFLYYKFGEDLETQIMNTHITFELIRPYKNVEFERYLYVAGFLLSISCIEAKSDGRNCNQL